MEEKKLLQRLAYLESINDHLMTEVSDVDRLMRLIGFAEGLETVKNTAREIIDRGYRPLNGYYLPEKSLYEDDEM